MNDRRDLCKQIIELATGLSIETIEVHVQDLHKSTISSKGIIIDVKATDSKSWYTVEMQNEGSDNIFKRARYYHSTTDVACLNKGQYYEDIMQNYVIFICSYDPFKLGLPVYHVKNSILEKPDKNYDDGQYTIFLNADYRKENSKDVNEDLLCFLNYIKSDLVSTELTTELENAVKKAHFNDKWRATYMDINQLELGWKREGEKIGKTEGKIQLMFEMVNDNIIPVDDAAARLNMSVSEFLEKANQLAVES